jgi:hypothetical protein
MDVELARRLVPGASVTVTQQIPARSHVWTSTVRGTIVAYQQRTTGSWFAHARNDKLWLDRLTIRKDDGELITLVLDAFSRVELDTAVPPAAQAALP